MNRSPFRSRALRLLAVLAVTLLALGLRLRAVDKLPIDYDEDDYVRAGQLYAAGLSASDWGVLTKSNYRVEHPPLGKLAYGVVFAVSHLPPAPVVADVPITAPPARSLPEPFLALGRLTSATFGSLAVLVLALLSPVAALFLSIHTFTIKYTSEVMLDALPSLFGVSAAWLYVRSQGKWNGRWVLSAMAAGLAVASKYLHAVVGIAIALHLLAVTYKPDVWRRPSTLVRWLGPTAAWGLMALAAFWLADPYLWPDPMGRFRESVAAVGYTVTNPNVQSANFPAWQPLVWLFGPVPWHPGVFVFPLDLGITLLALAGLRPLWRRRSVFVLWLLIGLIVLTIWRTKWPQYILVLTAPLSLAAAEGFRVRIWEPFTGWWEHTRANGLHWPKPARQPDARRAVPWLVPGLLVLALITLFPLLFQLAMALTDFNAISIRDGINGGVWRAVWQGLTGAVKPVEFSIGRVFERLPTNRDVHFTGPRVLLELFSGALNDVLFFNILWAALSVTLQTALGLGAALLLHRRGVSFRGGWRAIFILPWAIPEYIGALIWFRLFEPNYGWLNLLVSGSNGVVARANPLADPLAALIILLMAALWYGFPLVMLAATAGLKQIPAEVYDAAAMDGAGGWAQFQHITWPMLFPLLAPAILIRAIFAFNQFYLFYVMNPPGSMLTFATLSYYVFNPTGRFGGWFAISAAINIFTVIVLMGLVIWLGRVSKAAEGVTYA